MIEFRAKRSQDYPEFLLVWCDRENCPSRGEHAFLVHARSWLRPHHYTDRRKGVKHKIVGRSCPYCFRPSRIPARS